MTSHTSEPFIMAVETSDEADEDPGPSCLDVLVAHDEWRELGDVECMVHRAYAATALKLATIDRRDVTVLLTSDAEIADLNAQYRGHNKPTNVLSFPAAALPAHLLGADTDSPLGDIAVAYQTLVSESTAEGKPPLFHLAHLTVHGLLHLAGFDHEADAEAERMEALEREILGALDIPDPYFISSDEEPALLG